MRVYDQDACKNQLPSIPGNPRKVNGHCSSLTQRESMYMKIFQKQLLLLHADGTSSACFGLWLVHMEHVLHVLVSYCVTVLSMLQLLYIYPRGQTVPGIRPYIYGVYRYVPPYRLWFWGSRSLNRLTLFDLVGVVYPVWSLDRIPLLYQVKFTKGVNAQLEKNKIIC